MKHRHATLAALMLMQTGAAALGFGPIATDDPQRASSPNARPYQGMCVVRVRTTSQAQLDAVLDLASDVWSERVGIGVLEIQISRDKLPLLSTIHVPHDVLIPDLQAHAEHNQQQMNEVRARQALQRPDGFQRTGTVHDDSWFETYRTLDEIESYTQNIATLRPDLASVSVIGQSWEGRDMHAVTITAPDLPGNPASERPAVFIFSTVHAREWIAPMTTCYIASKLVADYNTVPQVQDLLRYARIVVVPIGNPDGYLFTWSDQRFWRNTRRANGDGTFGVNINRNWGYEWGNEGSSGSTTSTNYRGTHAFSEPETRALRDLALGLGDKLVAHIDYHSYSQLIMWPYGYEAGVITPEPAATIFESLATEMAGTIRSATNARYTPMQSVDLYPAAGDSSDWFFGELNTTSFTIELRPADADFNPPPATIFPCASENYTAFLNYIDRSIRPINIWARPFDETLLNLDEPAVAITSSALELIDPSQVTLHTRVLGADQYQHRSMTRDSDGTYIASLAPMRCGQTIEYYFSVEDQLGSDQFPAQGQTQPLRSLLLGELLSLNDPIETDTGWIAGMPQDTATQGQWNMQDPEPTTHQPGDDHTADGTMCWVTDGRGGTRDQHDVDSGYTTLITPRFSALPGDSFGFWVAFSSAVPSIDRLEMRISNNDGATWTFVGNIPNTNGEWTFFDLPIDRYVEPNDMLRVYFRAFDLSGDNTVEAAIDDFRVLQIGCPQNPADLDANGELTFFDVVRFLEGFQNLEPISDFNNDGEWNFFDVAAFLIAYNGA